MQEKSPPEFADRLKRAMANHGLRAAGLAEKACISKGYLSDLLKGNKAAPSFEVAKKFSEILHCSPSWLLFGVEEDQKAGNSAQVAGGFSENKDEAGPEPTMADAFRKMGEALDILRKLMENQPPK